MFRYLVLSLSAAALFAGAHAASAQGLVFDSLTGATSFTSTSSTPHTQVGQVFNLGGLTQAASPISITGSDFLLASSAAATYTDVQVTQFFWASASLATTGSTAAYSTLLGSITYDLGTQTFASGFVYTFNGGPNGFSSPVVLNSLTTTAQIGFSELVTASTGAGALALNNAIYPAFSVGTPAVGSSAFNTNATSTNYYRNVLSETNGNFIGSDERSLSGLDYLGLRLYATSAPATGVPEPSSVAMFALAAVLTAGVAFRRRAA